MKNNKKNLKNKWFLICGVFVSLLLVGVVTSLEKLEGSYPSAQLFLDAGVVSEIAIPQFFTMPIEPSSQIGAGLGISSSEAADFAKTALPPLEELGGSLKSPVVPSPTFPTPATLEIAQAEAATAISAFDEVASISNNIQSKIDDISLKIRSLEDARATGLSRKAAAESIVAQNELVKEIRILRRAKAPYLKQALLLETEKVAANQAVRVLEGAATGIVESPIEINPTPSASASTPASQTLTQVESTVASFKGQVRSLEAELAALKESLDSAVQHSNSFYDNLTSAKEALKNATAGEAAAAQDAFTTAQAAKEGAGHGRAFQAVSDLEAKIAAVEGRIKGLNIMTNEAMALRKAIANGQLSEVLGARANALALAARNAGNPSAQFWIRALSRGSGYSWFAGTRVGSVVVKGSGAVLGRAGAFLSGPAGWIILAEDALFSGIGSVIAEEDRLAMEDFRIHDAQNIVGFAEIVIPRDVEEYNDSRLEQYDWVLETSTEKIDINLAGLKGAKIDAEIAGLETDEIDAHIDELETIKLDAQIAAIKESIEKAEYDLGIAHDAESDAWDRLDPIGEDSSSEDHRWSTARIARINYDASVTGRAQAGQRLTGLYKKLNELKEQKANAAETPIIYEESPETSSIKGYLLENYGSYGDSLDFYRHMKISIGYDDFSAGEKENVENYINFVFENDLGFDDFSIDDLDTESDFEPFSFEDLQSRSEAALEAFNMDDSEEDKEDLSEFDIDDQEGSEDEPYYVLDDTLVAFFSTFFKGGLPTVLTNPQEGAEHGAASETETGSDYSFSDCFNDTDLIGKRFCNVCYPPESGEVMEETCLDLDITADRVSYCESLGLIKPVILDACVTLC